MEGGKEGGEEDFDYRSRLMMTMMRRRRGGGRERD